MNEELKCAVAGAMLLGIYLVAISFVSFLIGLVL